MLDLSVPINNDNLPIFRTDMDIIRSDPGYLGWFTADDLYVDKSGDEIVTFFDRFDETKTFTSSGPSRYATMVPAAINGWSAARLDTDQSTDWDEYSSAGFTLAPGAASFAVIFKADTLGIAQSVLGRYNSTTSRLLLQITATNKPRMLAENYYAEGAAALVSGEPVLLIGSFDGSATARMWHKGLITSGTTTGGDTHSGALRLGTLSGTAFQTADLDIAEWGVFSRDLLADDQDETLAAILRQASQLYGCVVD